MKDIEKIIREVDGTMSMEGMPMSNADKARIRSCLRNKEQFDKEIRALIQKHSALSQRKNHAPGL